MTVEELEKILRDVQTPDIVTALMERFENAIFFGEKIDDGGEIHCFYDWCGNPTVCKGMTIEIQSVIKEYEEGEI